MISINVVDIIFIKKYKYESVKMEICPYSQILSTTFNGFKNGGFTAKLDKWPLSFKKYIKYIL